MRKQQQQVPPRRQADTAEPSHAGRGEVLRCLKKTGIRTGNACLRGPVSRGAEKRSIAVHTRPTYKGEDPIFLDLSRGYDSYYIKNMPEVLN